MKKDIEIEKLRKEASSLEYDINKWSAMLHGLYDNILFNDYNIKYILNSFPETCDEIYDDYLPFELMLKKELKEILIILKDIWLGYLQEIKNYDLYYIKFSKFIDEVEYKKQEKYKQLKLEYEKKTKLEYEKKYELECKKHILNYLKNNKKQYEYKYKKF